jgi:hypothetical protein
MSLSESFRRAMNLHNCHDFCNSFVTRKAEQFATLQVEEINTDFQNADYGEPELEKP